MIDSRKTNNIFQMENQSPSVKVIHEDKLKLKEELINFENILIKKKRVRDNEKKTKQEKAVLKKELKQEMNEVNKKKMTYGNKYLIKNQPLSNTRKPTQKIIRQAITNVVGEEKAHLIFKEIIYHRKEKLNACSKEKKLIKIPFQPKN